MVERSDLERTLDHLGAAMTRLDKASFQEQYPSSLVEMDTWEWPQGIGLYGLWKRYERTRDPAVLAYLEEWFDRKFQPGAPPVERNVNTTSPMLTLACLYGETKEPEYLKRIVDWVSWMEHGLIRAGDDAFQHMITRNPNPGQILIDTIFMALLFLAKASTLLDRPELGCEVEYQLLVHAKYLLDKQSGLFFHGWDFAARYNYGGVLWARGNAWYSAGLMELLDMDFLSPSIRRYLLGLYRNQAVALLRLQDDSGLWHTILDDPTSYLEASASAGFLYGLARGARGGLLDLSEYRPALERAVEGLLALVNEEGLLGQVSYGTPVGDDAEFYKRIPIHPMTYGQALAVLAFQELTDPFWAEVLVIDS